MKPAPPVMRTFRMIWTRGYTGPGPGGEPGKNICRGPPAAPVASD